MLRNGDSLAALRAKWFHRRFEQQELAHHGVQQHLAAAVVVPIDLVQPDVDLIAVLWAHVLRAVERGQRKVRANRNISQAARTGCGNLGVDMPLYQDIRSTELRMYREPPVLGSRLQLSIGKRRRQPIRADSKVPIRPRLVEVLDL